MAELADVGRIQVKERAGLREHPALEDAAVDGSNSPLGGCGCPVGLKFNARRVYTGVSCNFDQRCAVPHKDRPRHRVHLPARARQCCALPRRAREKSELDATCAPDLSSPKAMFGFFLRLRARGLARRVLRVLGRRFAVSSYPQSGPEVEPAASPVQPGLCLDPFVAGRLPNGQSRVQPTPASPALFVLWLHRASVSVG